MRAPSLLKAAKARLRPRNLLGVGIIMTVISAARVTLGDVPVLGELPHWLVGVLLALAVIALAPMPWEWTGDERRRAPALRGLAQALAFDAVWLLLLLLLVAPFRPLHRNLDLPRRNPVAAQVQRSFQDHPRARRALAPLAGLLPLVLGVGWLVAAFQAAEDERAEAVRARRTLEQAAREAQEQALKAQLDPHVLYNALGGITELVREDPERAEEALLSLAELYRKLTALGRRAEVALGEERAVVADYLAVEQIRLGARLRVAWDWPEALGRRTVPPLLVQPLVENAIKHGLAPSARGGGLFLEAREQGAGLRLRVSNEGAPLAQGWTPGTGLSNLAQRLAILGGGSRFELRSEGALTVAEVLLFPEGRP